MAGHPLVKQILTELQTTHDRKNQDYTAGEPSKPIGNFERVAQIMALYPGLTWSTPFGVILTYLLKQLDATLTLYASGQASATGEHIPQRLRDVQLYGILAEVAYHEEKHPLRPVEPRLSGQAWADEMNRLSEAEPWKCSWCDLPELQQAPSPKEIKATDAQYRAIHSIARNKGIPLGTVAVFTQMTFGHDLYELNLDQAAETIKSLERL